MKFNNNNSYKNVKVLLIAIILQILGCSNSNDPVPSIITGMVTDFDGNVYKTIKIGTQWWMAENLRVKHDPQGNQLISFAYNGDPTNEDMYGRLYFWDTAMDSSVVEGSRGIAPEGWHIPSKDDWQILFDFLGGIEVSGGKLKQDGTNYWQAPNTGATNSSGFTALPAGGYANGNYHGKGIATHFWSSSESNGNAFLPTLHAEYASVLLLNESKLFAHSIRCVKDN